MNQPTTPQTAPSVITTHFRSSPTRTSVYAQPQPGAPVQYRIERRTVYITSTEPPSSAALNDMLKLAELSDEEPIQDTRTHRRTRSFEDRLSPQPRHSPITRRRDQDSNILQQGSGVVRRKNPSTTHLTVPSGHNTAPNTPSSYSQMSWTPTTPVRPRILFYHRQNPHYGFTNFSPHPVIYQGKRYPTSEHLFQSFKFHGHRPNLAEHIRTCSEYPSVAFSEARRFAPEVRRDWKAVNIDKMNETLWYKFTQHKDLKDELLATGDAELVEDSDKDSFWGVGADGSGRNELGKALERLRTRLYQE